MNLTFGPNGNVEGYKTNFMKELFPELKADTDVVLVFNPVPETSVVIVKDNDGHICGLCKKSTNEFAEFENNILKRMCLDCCTNIYKLLNVVKAL